MNNKFLPVTKQDKPFDFICLTGDAYVDHPSFGIAIISRMLESLGFAVGIIAQPVSDDDFSRLGAPKRAFMVTGGNIDSMVANYTVSGKKRHDDAYSENGTGGKRPDRAVNAYCQKLKKLFPACEIVIGGLEASLRRFAHYDFWSDSILPSVLVSSGADLLLYGMAELTLVQLAGRLRSGEKASEIHDLRGTCYLTKPSQTPLGAVQCADYEHIKLPENKAAYAKACKLQYNEQDEVTGKTIIQRHGKQMLVQNPPQRSLTTDEMDRVYALPFTRIYHSMYKHVPAIEEVEFSIIHNRGCFGNCSFCSLAFHQGRRIQIRSEESVIEEAESFTKNPNFKGYIHDVGGPTANFRKPSCRKQLKSGMCKNKQCFSCENLDTGHEEYLRLLRKLRSIKGVKKVFIRSGIRFDFVNRDKNKEFLRELVEHHTSGQLKVAPEHAVPRVLHLMSKPQIEEYERFAKNFYSETKKCGKEQYLVPYLMSSHPGATLKDAVELALFLKKHNIRPEQVQDFYPTPGTISTAMFYTGLNPLTMEKVYVTKDPKEKQMQRALLQYYKPENREIVRAALNKINRRDLISILIGGDKNLNNAKKQFKPKKFKRKK
ncbi:MAG: YgiQ family radical SAM protein [Oscillospiraceae bacterium]|nr:YgiQ family radical SAM protein [Oscillospiraceae bacterium]